MSAVSKLRSLTGKLGWFSGLGCSQNEGTWTESPCFTSQQLVQKSTKWPKRVFKTLKSQDIEGQTGRGTSQNHWIKNLCQFNGSMSSSTPWFRKSSVKESFSMARPHSIQIQITAMSSLRCCFFPLSLSVVAARKIFPPCSSRFRSCRTAVTARQQALWFQHRLGISLKKLHLSDFY